MATSKFVVEVKLPSNKWQQFDWWWGLDYANACVEDLVQASRSNPRTLFKGVRLKYRGIVLKRVTP